MISNITSDIIGAIIVLGAVIVLHELGHFLVAKLFKIKVETFSVGFGPRLFGFRYGDTDYRISAFPLGGYVKMSGENPGENLTGDPHEFMSKPKWQRFLVAGAGPAMNVLLAIALLTGLFMYGRDIPAYWSGTAVIGVVESGSPAEAAGLRANDKIVAIDGKENPTWQDVENRVITSPNNVVDISVERDGMTIQSQVTPAEETQDGPTGPMKIGEAGMCPLTPVIVKRVWSGYPGESAGLLAGDEIVAVNGLSLKSSCSQIPEVIRAIPEKTFPITVVRNGETKEVQVTPRMDEGRRLIGMDIPYPTIKIKNGFVDALSQSVETNVEQATLMFEMIGKLFKREASFNQLAGPIGIVRVSGQAYELGPEALIVLMALISLNLGVINVLPIPILDGGVMLLILVEGIMRRDLSLRVKERIVQVGFVFLLVVMVFVFYNDILKLMPAGSAP